MPLPNVPIGEMIYDAAGKWDEERQRGIEKRERRKGTELERHLLSVV